MGGRRQARHPREGVGQGSGLLDFGQGPPEAGEDAERRHLLREVEAPGEYRLANDVEFVIDNYGNVTITKGTENGNAELSDNTITLYDTMMDAEEVEQRERETTREVPLGTILAQTGDMLPILGIGAIVLASLIALIVAGRRRHEGKDDKN